MKEDDKSRHPHEDEGYDHIATVKWPFIEQYIPSHHELDNQPGNPHKLEDIQNTFHDQNVLHLIITYLD